MFFYSGILYSPCCSVLDGSYVLRPPDHQGAGLPPHKKKRKSADRSPSLSSSHPTDTAMGLLQAITSPLATGCDPSAHLHKKPSYPSLSSSHSSSKERKREGGSGGSMGSHSSSHSRPPSSSSSSKKHSSKSSLFHGGVAKDDPLSLRDAEGLKMKLILSPKEEEEGFPRPLHPSSGGRKGGVTRDRERLSKGPRKKQLARDPLPVVGKEVEVEGKTCLTPRDTHPDP